MKNYKIIKTIKENIVSKRFAKLLNKIFIIIFIILLIILAPFAGFAIQHILSNSDSLYTYTYKSSIGEPINIIVKNSNISSIITGLEKKGWIAVPTFSSSNESTWSISVKKGVTPVSPRYFNGKIQEISLEGPNSTIYQRHHARFWEVNGSVYGTVSYDSDITFIPVPVHIIDKDIDSERNFVGKIVSEELDLKVLYNDNIFPLLYKNNNAGSWYYTDGEIIVLTKNNQAANFQKILSLRRNYFRILGIVINLF